MAYKKKSGSPRSKSTVKTVATNAAAAAGGAILGAALGKLGLVGGIGLMIAGATQNNPLLTIAGAAAAVAPGALSSTEKSATGGVKGYIEDAQASVKKLAANVLPKTGINLIMPNAFPSLQLGEVDASYYGGASEAETRFNNMLMSGYGDGNEDMGRLIGSEYQASEVDGEVSGFAGIDGFSDTAASVSANW